MLLFHDNGLLLKTSEYVLWVKTMTPGVLSGLDKHHVTAVSPNQVVCGGSEPVRWFGQSHFESHWQKQHVWFRTEDVIFLTEHQERMYLPLFQLSFYYFCKLDVKHSSHSLFRIALLHKNNSLKKRTSACYCNSFNFGVSTYWYSQNRETVVVKIKTFRTKKIDRMLCKVVGVKM